MTIPEKQKLVRLLHLYQADLLDQNRENIENGITKDFVPGVKAQYEHARYKIEGYYGCYCADCVKEIQKEEDLK